MITLAAAGVVGARGCPGRVGYTLLFLAPSLILFSIGLLVVGSAGFALWLVYLLFVFRYFPKVQTARYSSMLGGARAD